MLLSYCEITLVLTWSEDCVMASNAAGNQAVIFAIICTKIDFLVLTLSSEVTAKLLQQLKSSFKRTINRNKYKSVYQLLS